MAVQFEIEGEEIKTEDKEVILTQVWPSFKLIDKTVSTVVLGCKNEAGNYLIYCRMDMIPCNHTDVEPIQG